MPEGLNSMDDFVQIGATSRGAIASSGVTVAIHNDNISHIACVAITISESTMDELAWKIGDRVLVLEGRNQSKGMLLLKPCLPDTPGSYKLTRQSSAATIKISCNKFTSNDVPKASRRAVQAKHMAFNTELKISLPNWDEG